MAMRLAILLDAWAGLFTSQVKPAGFSARTPAMMRRLELEPFCLARKQVDGLIQQIEDLVPPDRIPQLRTTAQVRCSVVAGKILMSCGHCQCAEQRARGQAGVPGAGQTGISDHGHCGGLTSSSLTCVTAVAWRARAMTVAYDRQLRARSLRY
eukprot:scaffold127222_cov32-Tisochrysis_lutea.AAC.8